MNVIKNDHQIVFFFCRKKPKFAHRLCVIHNLAENTIFDHKLSKALPPTHPFKIPGHATNYKALKCNKIINNLANHHTDNVSDANLIDDPAHSS